MSIAMLKADILQAREEFRDLWREHWRGGNGLPRGVYHKLTSAKEARLGDIADRIAAMHRIESYLRTKEMVDRNSH